MKSHRLCLLIVTAFILSGCGTRSSASVTSSNDVTSAKSATKSASQVIVSEADITNKPYESLGDIKVTVSKWTIFDSDPTREKVAEALKEKAASMGADAVVLVRYGTLGIGFTSWGQMEGNGRAVIFK